MNKLGNSRTRSKRRCRSEQSRKLRRNLFPKSSSNTNSPTLLETTPANLEPWVSSGDDDQPDSDDSAESILIEKRAKQLLDIGHSVGRRNIFKGDDQIPKIRPSIIGRTLRNKVAPISSTPMSRQRDNITSSDSSLNISPIKLETDENTQRNQQGQGEPKTTEQEIVVVDSSSDDEFEETMATNSSQKNKILNDNLQQKIINNGQTQERPISDGERNKKKLKIVLAQSRSREHNFSSTQKQKSPSRNKNDKSVSKQHDERTNTDFEQSKKSTPNRRGHEFSRSNVTMSRKSLPLTPIKETEDKGDAERTLTPAKSRHDQNVSPVNDTAVRSSIVRNLMQGTYPVLRVHVERQVNVHTGTQSPKPPTSRRLSYRQETEKNQMPDEIQREKCTGEKVSKIPVLRSRSKSREKLREPSPLALTLADLPINDASRDVKEKPPKPAPRRKRLKKNTALDDHDSDCDVRSTENVNENAVVSSKLVEDVHISPIKIAPNRISTTGEQNIQEKSSSAYPGNKSLTINKGLSRESTSSSNENEIERNEAVPRRLLENTGTSPINFRVIPHRTSATPERYVSVKGPVDTGTGNRKELTLQERHSRASSSSNKNEKTRRLDFTSNFNAINDDEPDDGGRSTNNLSKNDAVPGKLMEDFGTSPINFEFDSNNSLARAERNITVDTGTGNRKRSTIHERPSRAGSSSDKNERSRRLDFSSNQTVMNDGGPSSHNSRETDAVVGKLMEDIGTSPINFELIPNNSLAIAKRNIPVRGSVDASTGNRKRSTIHERPSRAGSSSDKNERGGRLDITSNQTVMNDGGPSSHNSRETDAVPGELMEDIGTSPINFELIPNNSLAIAKRNIPARGSVDASTGNRKRSTIHERISNAINSSDRNAICRRLDNFISNHVAINADDSDDGGPSIHNLSGNEVVPSKLMEDVGTSPINFEFVPATAERNNPSKYPVDKGVGNRSSTTNRPLSNISSGSDMSEKTRRLDGFISRLSAQISAKISTPRQRTQHKQMQTSTMTLGTTTSSKKVIVENRAQQSDKYNNIERDMRRIHCADEGDSSTEDSYLLTHFTDKVPLFGSPPDVEAEFFSSSDDEIDLYNKTDDKEPWRFEPSSIIPSRRFSVKLNFIRSIENAPEEKQAESESSDIVSEVKRKRQDYTRESQRTAQAKFASKSHRRQLSSSSEHEGDKADDQIGPAKAQNVNNTRELQRTTKAKSVGKTHSRQLSSSSEHEDDEVDEDLAPTKAQNANNTRESQRTNRAKPLSKTYSKQLTSSEYEEDIIDEECIQNANNTRDPQRRIDAKSVDKTFSRQLPSSSNTSESQRKTKAKPLSKTFSRQLTFSGHQEDIVDEEIAHVQVHHSNNTRELERMINAKAVSRTPSRQLPSSPEQEDGRVGEEVTPAKAQNSNNTRESQRKTKAKPLSKTLSRQLTFSGHREDIVDEEIAHVQVHHSNNTRELERMINAKSVSRTPSRQLPSSPEQEEGRVGEEITPAKAQNSNNTRESQRTTRTKSVSKTYSRQLSSSEREKDKVDEEIAPANILSTSVGKTHNRTLPSPDNNANDDVSSDEHTLTEDVIEKMNEDVATEDRTPKRSELKTKEKSTGRQNESRQQHQSIDASAVVTEAEKRTPVTHEPSESDSWMRKYKRKSSARQRKQMLPVDSKNGQQSADSGVEEDTNVQIVKSKNQPERREADDDAPIVPFHVSVGRLLPDVISNEKDQRGDVDTGCRSVGRRSGNASVDERTSEKKQRDDVDSSSRSSGKRSVDIPNSPPEEPVFKVPKTNLRHPKKVTSTTIADRRETAQEEGPDVSQNPRTNSRTKQKRKKEIEDVTPSSVPCSSNNSESAVRRSARTKRKPVPKYDIYESCYLYQPKITTEKSRRGTSKNESDDDEWAATRSKSKKNGLKSTSKRSKSVKPSKQLENQAMEESAEDYLRLPGPNHTIASSSNHDTIQANTMDSIHERHARRLVDPDERIVEVPDKEPESESRRSARKPSKTRAAESRDKVQIDSSSSNGGNADVDLPNVNEGSPSPSRSFRSSDFKNSPSEEFLHRTKGNRVTRSMRKTKGSVAKAVKRFSDDYEVGKVEGELVNQNCIDITMDHDTVRLKYIETDPKYKLSRDNQMVTEPMQTSNGSVSGYLKLPPGAIKSPHTTKKHSLWYFIIQGEGRVQVHNSISHAKTLSRFSVPLGVTYSIMNASQDEPLILGYVKMPAGNS